MGLTMDKTTTVATYFATLTGFFASLSISEKLAIGHLAIAVATFLVNWTYKILHYRLARRQREAATPPEGEE